MKGHSITFRFLAIRVKMREFWGGLSYCFLVMRVVGIEVILGQLRRLKQNTLNFSIRRFSGKLCFPLFFCNKEVF